MTYDILRDDTDRALSAILTCTIIADHVHFLGDVATGTLPGHYIARYDGEPIEFSCRWQKDCNVLAMLLADDQIAGEIGRGKARVAWRFGLDGFELRQLAGTPDDLRLELWPIVEHMP